MQHRRSHPKRWTVRLADPRDIPRLTEICLTAMPMDPLFPYLWPKRHEFPNDHRFYWQCKLEDNLFNPRYVTIIAEEYKPGADTPEDFVSFAIWERKYDNTAARNTAPAVVSPLIWPEKAEHRLDSIDLRTAHMRYHHILTTETLLTGRRDSAPARLSACDRVVDNVNVLLERDLAAERLQIELIATHPTFQRLGAGSALMQWGLDRAKLERLPVSAMASPCGERLYRKNGLSEFHGKRKWRIAVEGETEMVEFVVMVWRNE